MSKEDRAPSPVPSVSAPTGRASYVAPRLEALGTWSAFTLQQSIPINPDIGILNSARRVTLA